MPSTKPLDSISESPSSSSPARGKEMRTNLLSKLRPPPLVHVWDFWHEKALPQLSTNPSNAMSTPYGPTLTHLLTINDVRAFWSLFNNFSFDTLPLHSSAHLFHHSVQPLWEDTRNARGGCWTFRVPREQAEGFWKEVCLLAIGEQLQAAVENSAEDEGGVKGRGFKDDICGISFSPRAKTTAVSVWTRDAGHAEGVKRVLEAVLEGIEQELRPREGTYYYKKHAEHEAFGKSGMNERKEKEVSGEGIAVCEGPEEKSKSVDDMAREMEMKMETVRKILEDVRTSDQAMERRLAAVSAGAATGAGEA